VRCVWRRPETHSLAISIIFLASIIIFISVSLFSKRHEHRAQTLCWRQNTDWHHFHKPHLRIPRYVEIRFCWRHFCIFKCVISDSYVDFGGTVISNLCLYFASIHTRDT
jgi:hypothetical protein